MDVTVLGVVRVTVVGVACAGKATACVAVGSCEKVQLGPLFQLALAPRQVTGAVRTTSCGAPSWMRKLGVLMFSPMSWKPGLKACHSPISPYTPSDDPP